MAQSLASPPEEGKRKPPSQQVFCWDAPGFVKNKCGLAPQDPTKDRPVSYFQGISSNFGYIKQKPSRTQFPVKQSKVSTPFKTWIVSTRITPPKKRFTAAPLRSPGANSESSAANLARTGTKPQPWWHGDGSGHRRMILPIPSMYGTSIIYLHFGRFYGTYYR